MVMGQWLNYKVNAAAHIAPEKLKNWMNGDIRFTWSLVTMPQEKPGSTYLQGTSGLSQMLTHSKKPRHHHYIAVPGLTLGVGRA